ncbi:helix-turn-helix domain-containing protein [Christensenellaceae bacterium OttesenSCG-928-K19]|nr:helix-turn-helix domain-containing protein [Christensenellaceae bacterium OttesenSCG-928-K19]
MSSIIESARKIVKAYQAVSELDCGIIDLNDADAQQYFSPFCIQCYKVQVEQFGRAACQDMIPYACYQSERWGGKYEWLCPLGLTFINTMLSKGREKMGIVVGPFLMTDREEFLSEELPGFFDGKAVAGLKKLADTIPYVECGRVSSFADVLYMLTSYAMERDSIELRIMEQLATSDSEQFTYITDMKNEASNSYRYPIEAEKSLQNYIAQGNRPAAQKVLNEILGNVFFCSGGDFNVIKARTTELIVLLSRAAIEGGADVVQVFGLNYDYLRDIDSFKTLDELNTWLANVLIRFTNSVFDLGAVKHSDIILDIITYIRQNYMQKITLNDISSNVNFSVSYISRVFKDEMGISITGFINKVRVDNAKMLLLDKDIPLVEVAYLCGFEDQTYFNKVFKKQTGTSPGKYRDKRGNI